MIRVMHQKRRYTERVLNDTGHASAMEVISKNHLMIQVLLEQWRYTEKSFAWRELCFSKCVGRYSDLDENPAYMLCGGSCYSAGGMRKDVITILILLHRRVSAGACEYVEMGFIVGYI